jgi:hypothetical protein
MEMRPAVHLSPAAPGCTWFRLRPRSRCASLADCSRNPRSGIFALVGFGLPVLGVTTDDRLDDAVRARSDAAGDKDSNVKDPLTVRRRIAQQGPGSCFREGEARRSEPAPRIDHDLLVQTAVVLDLIGRERVGNLGVLSEDPRPLRRAPLLDLPRVLDLPVWPDQWPR